MAELDSGSPLPKYFQIKEIVRDMIRTEGLRAGATIPPEHALCARFGVSRMTTRQAIMELVSEGVLYREQGRGTFVAGGKLRQEARRLAGFTEDMEERGMSSSSTVLSAEVVRPTPKVSSVLNLDPSENLVRIRRVRNADDRPMALETSHLRHEVGRSLLNLDLSRISIYRELRRGGMRIDRAEQSYEVTAVGEIESEHLGVSAGSPAMLIERVTYDETGSAFEFVKSIYRGDRYRITTTLRCD